MVSIDVANVTKLYGKQKALNQISFVIKKGDIVGLLGPNGAGKSTLIKSLIGIQPINEGNISVLGMDASKNSLSIKKNTGYLAEDNPLYTDMYVKEYLNFCCKIRNLSSVKVDEVIEQVSLVGEQSKKIKSLSKGYKQRVGIAQAIIHNPEILILDEPTNGLDPNQIIEIRNLIKRISSNKTVIFSTHIMQEVEALCNRIILLNKGKKVVDDKIDNFVGQFKNLEEAFHKSTISL